MNVRKKHDVSDCHLATKRERKNDRTNLKKKNSSFKIHAVLINVETLGIGQAQPSSHKFIDQYKQIILNIFIQHYPFPANGT